MEKILVNACEECPVIETVDQGRVHRKPYKDLTRLTISFEGETQTFICVHGDIKEGVLNQMREAGGSFETMA